MELEDLDLKTVGLIVLVAIIVFAGIYFAVGRQNYVSHFDGEHLSGTVEVSATLLDRDGNPVDQATVKKLAWTTAAGAEVTQIKWAAVITVNYKDMVKPININANLTYPTDVSGLTAVASVSDSIDISTYTGSTSRIIEFNPVELPTLDEPDQDPTVYKISYIIDVTVSGINRFGSSTQASDSMTFTVELVWQRAHLEVKIIPAGSEPLAIFP